MQCVVLHMKKMQTNYMRLNVLFLVVGFLLISANVMSQQTNSISGRVTDSISGVPIVGATIILEGTSLSTSSELDGSFRVNTVLPGRYKVTISYISYKSKVFENIVVVKGEAKVIDAKMVHNQELLSEVVVSGRRLSGTELGILSEMRKATVIANGISSQTIQRTGDSDAAQVVKRIPGITIVDNRFINIRGLAERYNSVQLNNVVAPSLETDIRSFSFDLIPSSQIDRILVYKSPSAEIPGDFAGGVVKIFVKAVPDKDQLLIEYGTSYRENATFKDFQLPDAGKANWLGFNSGKNDLPINFPENLRKATSSERNAAGHSLHNSWVPNTGKAYLDQKLNLTSSKRFNINNKLLSNITSINYSNSKTNYIIERRDFNTFDEVGQSSSPIYHYFDNQYNLNVRLGIMHNWAFRINQNHTLEFKNLYNQFSTSQYTNRLGENYEAAYLPDSHSFNNLFRGIYSGQLSGSHKINEQKTVADWVVGYGRSNRDQPDYKRYRSDIDASTGERTLYVPTGAAAAEFLGRFYSKMDEKVVTGTFNIEHRLNNDERLFNPSIKIGAYVEGKDRDFKSRNIGYVRANSSLFNTDLLTKSITQLFEWENINTTNGIRIDEQSNPNDNYSASNRLIAGYANFILPYQDKLKLIAGVRIENNIQKLESADDQGLVNVDNNITKFLPSANLTYNLNIKTLLRAAYGKTLNRPEFRELAPFSFYDFDLNFTNKGNPDLRTATIDNYDIKFEHYPSDGELISLSVFYKRFKNPIETVFIPGAGSGGAKTFSFGNAEVAENKGIELELKKSFRDLTGSRFLNNLSLMLNASYIDSEVRLGDIALRQSGDRPLQGQAPYIVNTGLFYKDAETGWQVNAMYNVIGKRIAYIGYEGYPDIYEMPRNIMDLNITKVINQKLSVKASFNDLFNQPYLLLQDGNLDGKFDRKTDQTIAHFQAGRLVGLSFTYQIF